MTTKRIGRRIELVARDVLLAAEYAVHVTSPPQRRGPIWHGNDIFGAYDLIAYRENEPIRFIQVTADGSIGRKIAKIEDLPCSPHIQSEIWRYVGGNPRRYDGRATSRTKREGTATRSRAQEFVIYRRIDSIVGHEWRQTERIRIKTAAPRT